ncbi:MAG: Dam family site-specific DNA-(adenine-N6)-methyltransferase [Deltaproteobacteria bacterium]|nr:Dam family site-specific DNA-(adenine-N6)-methyltransferase [Deltaproteobacteria bacterium]
MYRSKPKERVIKFASAGDDSERVLAPMLRWAGSKRQHVSFLRQCWGEGDYLRYVEPFAGSAAAFFAIAPENALLGDINRELIQMYRAVCRSPRAVSQCLREFPKGENAYYTIRAMKPKLAVTKAARFIYLNRFCFNGLYRTNVDGKFNVPYGAPKTLNIPDISQFRASARLLRRANLIDGDFRVLLANVRAGDFVYLDPPYASSRRRVFIQYAKGHFSTKDLSDLAAWLTNIDRRGAAFVLSYADSQDARSAFRGWKTRRFAVRRNVAGFSNARRNHYELFLSNLDTF